MKAKRAKKIKVGDKVTCLHAVKAYYSDYGVNKGNVIWFKPGMVGTVSQIAPKTFALNPNNRDPRYDYCHDFVVVDFMDDQGNQQRVGLNFCNLKRLARASQELV